MKDQEQTKDQDQDQTHDQAKDHAQIVVIGGGVVGTSIAYHLTKKGVRDVMLLERAALTSGSTWHAAGGMHTINGDPNVAKLQQYTISLYKEIEEISGQDIGLHMTGGVMLAASEARFDWLKSIYAKGKYLGMEGLEIISAARAAELMPLIDPSHFVGGLYDPIEGHCDPYGVTHAYAKAARKNGAVILTQIMVEGLTQMANGEWLIRTRQGKGGDEIRGEIRAEHVINAGGLWAREIGRMVGLELPVLAMEHMYLLTENMDEVAAHNAKTGEEIIHAVDFDGELYLRQEGGGMLMGTYEKACVAWAEKTTSWDFGHELLAPDLDRIAPSLEVGFAHFPAFQNAGIKQVINGPFTFAPDGNPLIGPVQGLPNFWLACAVMAGFSQGGGVGLALANWIVDGDPGMDVWAMDASRFGAYATPAYTHAKVRENYARRFSIRYPNEELPAARPLLTTPIYDRMRAEGAQFGASFGLEVPLWFAPTGVRDEFSWRRSTDFDHVGREARAVRASVGLAEISNFAKYRFWGEGAQAWLDRMLAAKIPPPGRMTLAPMLKHDGRIIGDFSLSHLDEGRFFLVGSGMAEAYHMRWFAAHLPADGSVQMKAEGLDLTGLTIAGPQARALLQSLTDTDIGHDAFGFMAIKQMELGMLPALVGRVSYTGDLGYEIWVRPEYQIALWEMLMDKGKAFDLKLFGARAMNALRVEKNYGSWGREYRPIYYPHEAGLARFCAFDKQADFIGKTSAHKAVQENKGEYRLRVFVIDAKNADVIGDEPIFYQGAIAGFVTSGGYAHDAEKSVAMGYVRTGWADAHAGWSVELLGEMCDAQLQPHPLFDKEASRMRG